MLYNTHMLKHIALENIAVISGLEIDFTPGLNAITGETGAGKSVVLDAIQCVFDKRIGAKDLLRTGTLRGRVELTIDLAALNGIEGIDGILSDAGIEREAIEKELLLSRELSSGASRCRVNGVVVAMPVMESLGQILMEIVGQHDWHALFSSGRQRDLLDRMGGESLLAVRKQIRQMFGELNALKQQKEALLNQQSDRARQLDFLAFQLDELDAANLTDAQEDTKLQAERERLSHIDRLQQSALEATFILDSSDDGQASVISKLGRLQKIISTGTKVDNQFALWYSQLTEIEGALQTIYHEMGSYGQSLETQPEQLQILLDRLDSLEKIKRKYGGSLESAMQQYEALQAQYEQLENQEAVLNNWDEQITKLETTLKSHCDTLSDLRQAIALQLENKVQKELPDLMLPAARFQVGITPQSPGETGQDQIQFLFSANPGEPLKPLSQVASGGELARLMLALKLHTAEADGVATLILDEIDTGMSGVTVRAVAEKLQTLNTRCQVIMVTHQPIVAAQARQHIHLTKHTHDLGVTVSAQVLTNRPERKRILSQLVSGFDADDAITNQFIDQLLQAG